jgi:RNA recognition motif-containing protein
MPKKIYVGNLPSDITQQDAKSLFEAFGTVLYLVLDTDRRGTVIGAFLNMADTEADRAIRALNGVTYDGRSLTVNEIRP